MIGVIMMATMIPAVMKLSPVVLGSASEVADDRDARRRRRDALVDVGERLREDGERPQAVHDRRDRGEQVDDVDDRLAMRRGAISVTNSAMPMLTGTEITSAMMPDEEGAVDHRPGAVLALRRIPVVGEDRRSPLRGTRATRSSWSCTRSARGSRGRADRSPSAIQRNSWSVTVPGGRGPVPRPRRRRGRWRRSVGVGP